MNVPHDRLGLSKLNAVHRVSASAQPIMLKDVFRMDRSEMIDEVLVLDRICSFRLNPLTLSQLSNARLRGVLIAARQEFQQMK